MEPLTDEEMTYMKTNEKFHMHKEIQDMLNKIPTESKIRSWITQLKKLDHIKADDLNFPNRDEIWELCSLTYKVHMAKMGLEGVYQCIMKEYERKRAHNFEHTLLKVLYRCSLAYRSLQSIKKISKLIQQKDKVHESFEKKTIARAMTKTKESKEDKEDREQLLAGFCLKASRLHVLIGQFLDESGYFRGAKFRMQGKDV